MIPIKIALIAPNSANDEIETIMELLNNLSNILSNSTQYILKINHWTDTPEGIISDEFQEMIEDTLELEECDIVFCIFGSTLGTYDDECKNYRTVCELKRVINYHKQNGKPDAFVYFKELSNEDIKNDFDMTSKIIKLKDEITVNHKDYKDINDLSNLANARFLKFIFKDISSAKKEEKNTEILLGLNNYLEKIEELINISKEEILFTSTQMASSTDGEYGSLQKKIIQASKEFQMRNPNRNHYGVIDSSERTKRGAIELRNSVDDIILKFNSELESFGFNFFISDEEHIILRLRPAMNEDKYSIYIRNKDLAKKLKQIFLELWHNSQSMKIHFGKYFFIGEIKDFFQRILQKEKEEAQDFFQSLSSIDEQCNALPYTVINNLIDKYMITNGISEYSNENDFDLVFQSYEEGLDNTIEKINLHKIRNCIINKHSIDYELYAKTFFFMYFLANYLKVRHSLESIKEAMPNRNNFRILDIGGGGGASLLAIYNFIKKHSINCKSIDIIDTSKAQIEISKRISSDFSGIDIRYFNEDIFNKIDTLDQYDFIVGSNIFCELNYRDLTVISNKIKEKLTDSGLLLIIERTESGVYENLVEKTNLKQKKYIYQNERYKIPKKEIDKLENILYDKGLYSYKDYVKTGYTLRYALYE